MQAKLTRIAVYLIILALVALPLGAAASPEELAKESEAAAAASATTKPTPKMLMDKVNAGCELLQKEGLAAFSKFQGESSEFIFAGTYIWIHDMAGLMRMHPIKYKLNGKRLLNFKDSNGKLFFTEMNRVADEKGSGWVDYMWPKPGEKKASLKVSFVKACKVGDDTLVLGSGVYGLTVAEVEAAGN